MSMIIRLLVLLDHNNYNINVVTGENNIVQLS